MFRDRVDAGQQLAERVLHLRGEDVIVFGLPRGGVPVAAEVARALNAPLDVLAVRKLGVPERPELAMGAIGEDGVKVTNPDVIHASGVTTADLDAVDRRERKVLDRRLAAIREIRPAVRPAGRTAVVVDDGVATGATASAACRVARARGASRVVLAVPIIAGSAARALRREADEVIAVMSPEWLAAVGEWYEDFSATEDRDVYRCLADARRDDAEPNRNVNDAEPSSDVDRDVSIELDGTRLRGHLTVPPRPRGIVIFAHGSGSSSQSPRNRYVAGILNQAGFGTLLFDLLTPREAESRAAVFDIELLAERLSAVTTWAAEQAWCKTRPIGWFGASTGAGAALSAAAQPDAPVSAIVSRGGRPDLAGPRLGHVRAPTMLIVGGRDVDVLNLNRGAAEQLRCPQQLIVVPGATHLFEEPGTLEAAAGHARDWFVAHLRPKVQSVA
jgi:putative phosphoribosyl transferase